MVFGILDTSIAFIYLPFSPNNYLYEYVNDQKCH